MGTTVPQQHPAVVLRSHYTHVRDLLGTAMLAIVALAIAVVLLAAHPPTRQQQDDDGATTTRPVPGVNFWPWQARSRDR